MSFYGTGRELDMLQDALEAGGIAWWMMEYPAGTVFFSPNKIKMLGYEEHEADRFIHYTHFTDLIHPDDYEPAMNAMRALLTGEKDMYETKYRIQTKNFAQDGRYVVYYDKGKVVGRNNKGELAIAGIVLNVTENLPAKVAAKADPVVPSHLTNDL